MTKLINLLLLSIFICVPVKSEEEEIEIAETGNINKIEVININNK